MAIETQQFKRNVAYKFRIGDLLIGKPVLDGEKFTFLELGNKQIVRVNIIGNIVDRYDSQGEKKYTFLTLDDGSGQISLKTFGDDIEKFKNFTQGLTVAIIGVLRYFNNQLYISPEIIKEQDPKYLLVRKLELEKERSSNFTPMQREQITAVRDNILDKIRDAENAGGIDKEDLIMQLRNFSPDIINQEIKKLLEDGIIFEPRPGKVRWLG
ncbi:MAG: OB-fold nucleic acid binding domain-containing protein [Nanoarchaeota archaeon]|nr:OB-fold nucleic acid binding domain-containing protein [Nanoarchaeota archaeon]